MRLTPSQACDWANQLNHPFTKLSAEESWHLEQHLTPSQISDYRLATALYQWARESTLNEPQCCPNCGKLPHEITTCMWCGS